MILYIKKTNLSLFFTYQINCLFILQQFYDDTTDNSHIYYPHDVRGSGSFEYDYPSTLYKRNDYTPYGLYLLYVLPSLRYCRTTYILLVCIPNKSDSHLLRLVRVCFSPNHAQIESSSIFYKVL